MGKDWVQSGGIVRDRLRLSTWLLALAVVAGVVGICVPGFLRDDSGGKASTARLGSVSAFPPANPDSIAALSTSEISARIQKHPFWRQPLPAGMLDTYVQKARSTPGGILFVDELGNIGVLSGEQAQAFRSRSLRVNRPAGVGDRFVVDDLQGAGDVSDARWILWRLLVALDVAHFQYSKE
jgi:hypothetical protein